MKYKETKIDHKTALFVYTPPDVPDAPVAINCKVSKECEEYHKNLVATFIVNNEDGTAEVVDIPVIKDKQ